jgi:hypothetical protein
VRELVEAAKQIEGDSFTVPDLMEQTKWKKTVAYEVLGRAEELGIVAKGDHGRYRLKSPKPEPALKLPEKLKSEE